MYSFINILEHALAQFSNVLHFLDFWVVYKKKKASFDSARTYTIENLEVGTKKKPTMNLIVPQR
jgi:hypothetical protein